MTPDALHLLRRAYGAAVRERATRTWKPGRQLSEPRRDRLVDGVAIILGRGDPTPFAFEAFLTHGIRAGLVLEGGWRWRDADAASREVVRKALARIGAKRPSWKEASTPHHAQADAFTLFVRTRCLRCGWKLPPENRVFCCERCSAAWHAEIWRRRRQDELAALECDAA